MELYGKKVLVVGNARSGIGAAKLALNKGAKVCIYDGKPYEKWEAAMQESIDAMKSQGIEYALGDEPNVESYDLIILSPGVSPEIHLIQKARHFNISITGEFEFASWYCKAPIVAITGTNGKTTTTTLVGEMMRSFNPKTYVVGNIGNAFSEEVGHIPADGIVVAEVSSFQLETATTFHPKVSALLNITPDHLNRHGSMENYCACKYQIFANQTVEDYSILNIKDTYYEEAKEHTKANCIDFSTTTIPERGAYLKEGQLWENITGVNRLVCTVDQLFIKGTHNVENALAAIAIATAFGVPIEMIKRVLTTFKGVEHRTEYVTTKRGVDFFNDSKATNTDAAIAGLVGLSSLNKPIRLIAGGMDKKVSFNEWVKLFRGRVEKVYIIGETKEQIVNTCVAEGYHAYATYDTLDDAVLAAYEESKPEECILLSPACASWDMFESYEQRGRLFKELVNHLEG
ncbi:MAG: UDP-N-acetylmuramoyl-L-alanine--D-glutamate ligase [Candidatus Cellulosilyticum pullistercoris]|uniref:UDP-N-acetylmuramoylalanine--D-glutamate ligase n=1 Tax=Candidatus Cellulosilyticum pullistercoris TaxID=2838521 RepID=A0A9E2KAW9_9FIRM|nr:UDP-N-acetylmuramoyl-L-alanine--D-glutamate ligase [Candidatus Cellulosilyticum pullistercoris]